MECYLNQDPFTCSGVCCVISCVALFHRHWLFWLDLISGARAVYGHVAHSLVVLGPSNVSLPSLQDILGGGADKGPEEAKPEEGHVPEDD